MKWMEVGGWTTEWIMSRINIYILESVSFRRSDFACTHLRHRRYSERTMGVTVSCPPWRLSGELCSVRTTCLVTTYFLCVPAFLAAACLVTITLTLPRYISIKRTPERRL